MFAMENEQKKYEIGFLLNPFISEEKIDEETAIVRKVIEDRHGLITGEGRPAMKKLAYAVKTKTSSKGFESAYFGWLKFTLAPELLPEAKISFDKNENVIRNLIIKIPKETAAKKTFKSIVKKPRVASAPRDKKEERIKPEEIDKKLEEIIGK